MYWIHRTHVWSLWQVRPGSNSGIAGVLVWVYKSVSVVFLHVHRGHSYLWIVIVLICWPLELRLLVLRWGQQRDGRQYERCRFLIFFLMNCGLSRCRFTFIFFAGSGKEKSLEFLTHALTEVILCMVIPKGGRYAVKKLNLLQVGFSPTHARRACLATSLAGVPQVASRGAI